MNNSDWFDNSVMVSLRSGWLDADEFAHDGQSKRFKGILKVWKKASDRFVDENPFDTMPTVTFFAPPLNDGGRVMQTPPMGIVVYLAPTLEFNSQRDVNHTVAHELAHVALGHHLSDNLQMKEQAEKHEERPAEKAADELAATWGFPRRKRGKFGFVKMIEVYAREYCKSDMKKCSRPVLSAKEDLAVPEMARREVAISQRFSKERK